MTGDEYLWAILRREQVDTGSNSPVRGCLVIILPVIRKWANQFLLDVSPSGSFAKGTANRSGTDIDLFISLSEQTKETLKEVYDSLFKCMGDSGYAPRRQNVSIGIKISGYDVDLVPAKRQNALQSDHSLYRSKADTWTKTNVSEHVRIVATCTRVNEIRILKLWRNQNKIDFPSFYLELTVIEALRMKSTYSLAENVMIAFEYIRDKMLDARIVDPANSNNILSEELNIASKLRLMTSATEARNAQNWGQILQ